MAVSTTTKWYAGAAAASVAVIGAGWFLLVSPQKTSAEEITAQAQNVAQRNATTESEIAALKAEFKDLPQLQSQVAAIRTRIPSALSEPSLLRTLSANAKKSGLNLVSMQFQAPQPITSGTVAGAEAGGGNPFSAPGQVSQLPVAIQVAGSFADMRMYLNSLETMQRAMLVTGVDITRASAADGNGASGITGTITARVFMANPGTVASLPGSTTPITTAGASTGDAS
ncbi:MAG: type 4a pilus biogenesis protein PilO [Candidatus Nanopelagicales bacterium]|jgi:Tfp pilus assembly protein PilO